VIGYYFDSPVEAALRRNAARAPSERVPIAGIRGTYKRLEAPTPAEGFDELFSVTIGESGGFLVREWCGGPESGWRSIRYTTPGESDSEKAVEKRVTRRVD
jgi:hypothetical protein